MAASGGDAGMGAVDEALPSPSLSDTGSSLSAGKRQRLNNDDELSPAKRVRKAEGRLEGALTMLAGAKAELAAYVEGFKAVKAGAGMDLTNPFVVRRALQHDPGYEDLNKRVVTAQEDLKTAREGMNIVERRLNIIEEANAARAPALDEVVQRDVPDELRNAEYPKETLPWVRADKGVLDFTAQLLELKFEDVEVPGGRPLKVARLNQWPLFHEDDGGANGSNLVLRDEARRGYESAWTYRLELNTPRDADSDAWEGRFRVLTGPPGSGKSRGMTYLLSLALGGSERRPVVYEARNMGRAFAWLPEGDGGGFKVFVTKIRPGLPLAHMKLLSDCNVVYLIDTEAESGGGQASDWRYNVKCRGTTYVAASPKPDRLVDFGQQRKSSSRRNFCFNPWTVDELVAARKSMRWRVEPEELRSRVAEVGPFPRYIRTLETFLGRQAKMRESVGRVEERDVSALFRLKWDPDEKQALRAELMHHSALMPVRHKTADPNDFHAQKFRVAPASVTVAAKLGARFESCLRGTFTDGSVNNI